MSEEINKEGSEENKQRSSTESQTNDQPLPDDVLEQASGGGQDGSDLLIVNNGDGSDFLEGTSTEDTESSSSESEYKYVPVRRTS
jgi:hypothetical protein